MNVYIFPSLLILFSLWALFFAFRGKRRPKLHPLKKIALSLGGVLLFALAWATARSLPPLSLPAPRGILHAPPGFLSESASSGARARHVPPENPVYLVQAIVALVLEDGIHPVLCQEKRLPWPEEEGSSHKFHLALGPAEIDFAFKLMKSPESKDPKLRAWLGPRLKDREIKGKCKVSQPGFHSGMGGLRFKWKRTSGPCLFFADYWESTHNPLSEALDLAPRPSLPYLLALAVLPVGRKEKLETIGPKNMETYFNSLLSRAENLRRTKSGKEEEVIPAIPKGVVLAWKAPGIRALTDFVPAAATLLFAVLLLAQAFRRPYPVFLLLVFLSLLFLAGLDRSLLRRNLDLLRDSKAALPSRLLAAKWAEKDFFFRKTAVHAGVSLAGDQALPKAARKAAAALGRIYVP